MPPKPLLLCLMGPTASGKTDLAIALAEARDCELVSVDSALVYRGLDIGSAKPDYPHHLVDIRDPGPGLLGGGFRRRRPAPGRTRSAPAAARPLLVGGTMLYFQAFLEGLARRCPPPTPRIRAGDRGRRPPQHGWPWLHAQLARVDPEAAARIHPNHSQRLGRALEVYRASGIPLSQWQRGQSRPGELPGERYRVVQLAICPADRAVLHRRIAARFEQMLAAGLARGGAGACTNAATCTRTCRRSARWAIASCGSTWTGECSLEEAVAARHRRHPPAGQAPADLAAQVAGPALAAHRRGGEPRWPGRSQILGWGRPCRPDPGKYRWTRS